MTKPWEICGHFLLVAASPRWENLCHPWFPEIFSKEQEIT